MISLKREKINIYFGVGNMKKRIFLIAIIVILVALAYLAYTQVDNIKGVFYSFKYSNEEIESMITETDDALRRNLEEFIGHPIREFTEEENRQIEEGTVAKEQVIEKIVREELGRKGSASNGSNNVSYYITELYNLKNEYIGTLDGMVASAVAEYKALDKSERTRSKQLEIGAAYAKKAMALEEECDGKVANIVSSIEKELKVVGGSMEIITTINNAYTSEKNLKRAYYLNMFK